MRILFFIFFVFCVFGFSSAQHQSNNQFLKPRHCSTNAAILAAKIKLDQPISSHLFAMSTADQLFVHAFLKTNHNFSPESFDQYQVKVNTALHGLYTVLIPVEKYNKFINTPGIDYIELSKPVYPRLAEALAASKVNLVHQSENLSQSYTGKGVVVGVIDFGYDYTHPTFFDAKTGNYRIKRAWEQNNFTGQPPPGYTYGKEFSSETTIRNELTDIPLTGHGTNVASVVAGSGGDLPELYQGVAYESDIILVSLNAREGPAGNNSGVIDGIKYIFDYAESRGMPAVVNISQGHHTGPHDGTSLPDQAIDLMSGQGRIVVGAVGNEGDASGFYLHFDHTFDNENEILSYLVWPDNLGAGKTTIDIWGDPGENFEVVLETHNPGTKTTEARSLTFNSSDPMTLISGHLLDMEGDTLYYEGSVEVNALNNRPHAMLYVDYSSQARRNDVDFNNFINNDFIQLRLRSTSGTLHAYAANNLGEAFFTDLSGIGAEEFIEGVRVIGGNEKSTMGELGGTAKSIISVGGYITKNTFVNTAGQTLGVESEIGEQYFRTSQGPTLDGRIKPDITAPAGLMTVAENSFYADTEELIEVEKIPKSTGGEWTYGIHRGTSFAAPIVAGIIALMLEADPLLTPERAKELLQDNAETDGFTNSVPNNIWGYGKVNAHASVSELEQATSDQTIPDVGSLKVFPNPARNQIQIETELRGPVQCILFDYTGKMVFNQHLNVITAVKSIEIPSSLKGLFVMQLKSRNTMISTKVILID